MRTSSAWKGNHWHRTKTGWFRFGHYYSDAAIEQACGTVLAQRPRSILEIGGNTGTFSLALASACDDTAIALLDLPEQIALASQRFADLSGLPTMASGSGYPRWPRPV